MINTLLKKQARYDLPLHQDEGTGFILVLIALMAFLSSIILGFSIGLNQVMAGWSQGLENKITIEIPSQTQNDGMRDLDEVTKIQASVINALNEVKSIQSVQAVENTEILNMVASWLGDNSFTQNLPLPALVSVELQTSNPDTIKNIQKMVQDIDQNSFIDTHESWLSELFRLTTTLQTGLFIIIALIGVTTIMAVAGAIKAQIEIHRSDVELLHLIGAQDGYISAQFIRHAGTLSSVGAVLGVICGLITLGALKLYMQKQDYQILPDSGLSLGMVALFALIPIGISLISALSARYTILKVLNTMP